MKESAGIWFSELKDSWQERAFSYEKQQGKLIEATYRHYGDLPDGRHYGVNYFPPSDPWPPSTYIQIINENGLSQHNAAASEDWRSWKYSWPEAIAASENGKTIAWIIEGNLHVWRQKEGDFISDLDECLNQRLGDETVIDARFLPDGILEVKLESGSTAGYLCDGDTVVYPYEDGWITRKEETLNLAEAIRNGEMKSWPENVILLISESDGWGQFCGLGVRRVCFEDGIQRIEGEILAENPDLESLTIPASVQYVEVYAFRDCRNLNQLIIEGDLSRIAKWDRDAFEGCGCQEHYLDLRRKPE
ncbi:MAG: leucine-rich repeat protein [Erysipelotrichaceae bacterium]|nr:leucine-rich repeat protein [Erysipelotrichaceae bacterium]